MSQNSFKKKSDTLPRFCMAIYYLIKLRKYTKRGFHFLEWTRDALQHSPNTLILLKNWRRREKEEKNQRKGDDRRGFGDKEKKSHAWKQVRGSQ